MVETGGQPQDAGPGRTSWGRRVWLALLVVCTLGVLLPPHLMAVRQEPFMDERTVLKNVGHYFQSRTLVPADSTYPTLFSYLAAPVIAVHAARLHLRGELPKLGDLATLAKLDPLAAWGPARWLSVCALLVCALVVGLFAACRLGGLAGGAAGSALLVTPELLVYGAYALPDVTMMLFVALSLVASARLADTGSDRRAGTRLALWAGLAAGLAIATKYNALVSLVPLAAAHFILSRRGLPRRRSLGLLGVSGLAVVIGFVAGSPSWVLAPGVMWQGVQFVRDLTATGHLGMSGVPLLGQVELLWRASPVLFLAASAGLLAWWWDGRSPARRSTGRAAGWLALCLVAATLAVTAGSSVQVARYLYPLFPAGALFVGYGVHRLARRAPAWLCALVAVAVMVQPACALWRSGLACLQPSSTQEGRAWIENHLPPGSRVARDWAYVPALPAPDEYVRLRQEVLQSNLPERWKAKFAAPSYPLVVGAVEYSPPWLDAQPSGSYLVTSDACYARFLTFGRFTGTAPGPGSPLAEEFDVHRKFYRALFGSDRWAQVHTVDTGNGPRVLIFRKR